MTTDSLLQPNQPRAATIAIGADHAGVALKSVLAAALHELGHGVLDLGTNGPASVDYPDFAHAVCAAVLDGRAAMGVLICGTGIGMSIAANRHDGIRCALIHDVTGARLTRAHNDANVLALGARMIGEEVALDVLRSFLATPYEGGRHARRLAKLIPAPACTEPTGA
jgi:ribose 5-phosphate isomerase B